MSDQNAVACGHAECTRTFLDVAMAQEHAEAVHTYSDRQRIVEYALNAKYGQEANYNVWPEVYGIWVWVRDMADDWVVFSISGRGHWDDPLQKATYSIDESNNVTLGEPTPVLDRTIYEDLPQGEDD